MNPVKKTKRNLKRSVATKTGVPTTQSGRKRKVDSLVSQGLAILVMVAVVAYFMSGGSE